MGAEKTTLRRKSGALWLVIARGIALSLVIWACGLGLLTAVMTAGVVGETHAFPMLSALTGIAAFVGAVSVVRHTPWGSLMSATLTAALFTTLLLCVGLLSWQRVSWTGHGGTLFVWSILGGVAAGLLGRPRTKKRTRHTW